jgi:hypothetical protein
MRSSSLPLTLAQANFEAVINDVRPELHRSIAHIVESPKVSMTSKTRSLFNLITWKAGMSAWRNYATSRSIGGLDL